MTSVRHKRGRLTTKGPDAQLADVWDLPVRPSSHGLFTASRPVMALEHFRVPYRLAPPRDTTELDYVRLSEDGPALLWPATQQASLVPSAGVLRADGGPPIPIFTRVTPDPEAASLLARAGRSWEPASPVKGDGDEHLGSVWHGDDGSVFLPFDPDEAHLNFLTERYHGIPARRATADWRALARRAYYRSRGLMPRNLQLWLRRRHARLQARTQFPRWPIETGLHDFLEIVFTTLQLIAGERVPRIAAWPNGSTWALVLTHDVETAAGLAALDSVLELERSLGLRSSWNFVPRRYEVSPGRVNRMISDGFEVGVHGLYHDGRDLESTTLLRERLPGMREAAECWSAVGFRSPSTLRDWNLMPLLGFDYDSSYPDTDPFEPQGGGCCSWLPFFNQDMVELPLTMAQDHTLFEILRQPDERLWVQKAEFLRSRRGMALLDTHPDYLRDDRIFAAYAAFLRQFANDDDAWQPLPSEVSSWWRRRAETRIERAGDGWTAIGAAAGEARVEFVSRETERAL
jgi:hypothetical protein